MQTAGHATEQKADSDVDSSEQLTRESAPSGGQNFDQNFLQLPQQPQQQQQQRAPGHICEGSRCPCQRYENGELAVVVMNRNRNYGNQERDDSYQNIGRAQQQQQQQQQRFLSNRTNNGLPINPNFLNPHYQNPVDILRNYNRNPRINEPEENIYERLDDEDDDEDDDQRAEGARNENLVNPEMANGDNHTYERIDNRPWYRSSINNRTNNDHQVSGGNFWNFVEPTNSQNHYDHPRYAYLKSRVLDNQQSCLNRLGRLGRNCFSSENIASGGNSRRYVYQFGHNRMCQSCTRFPFIYRDSRYACQHCNNFHDRLRYYEHENTTNPLNNTRHYIYQVSRSCRCTFCRGDYQYARFPMSSNRLADSFRRECNCRNSNGCTCRERIMSSSNSAIYIGRIDRVGLVQSVNNPLYSNPTIYIGRIDRSCTSGLSNSATSGLAGNSLNSSSESAGGVSGAIPSTSGTTSAQNEPSTSTSQRGTGNSIGGSSVCTIGQNIERQHVCDDSCIRSHPGNVTGVCQFLGRNERPDCHSGRVSFHWWFVNRWLPPWGSQSQTNERNQSTIATNGTEQQPVPRIDESREQQESDTEESCE